MPFLPSTYHSRIYRDFKGIGGKNYREHIRFYEKHEEEILKLAFEEYLELLVGYTNALFETGAYKKQLLMAEVVIEIAIQQNIRQYQGEDLFRKTLFRKAAAHYNLFENQKAEHILGELIKMDRSGRDPVLFFRKCRQRAYPGLLNHFRAASIFLFLLVVFIVAFEVLLVRPFYGMYALWFAYSRNALFFLGCGIMIFGYLYIRWLAFRDTRSFLNAIAGQRSCLDSSDLP